MPNEGVTYAKPTRHLALDRDGQVLCQTYTQVTTVMAAYESWSLFECWFDTSSRLIDIMKWANVKCPFQLHVYTEKELYSFRNMGQITMKELKLILELCKITLRKEDS